MKFGFIVFALTTFSTAAHAYECNTVMGGCPTDNGQVTSSHMIGSAAKAAPQAPAVKPAASTATGRNTAAQAGVSKKNGAGSSLQTINKTLLK